MHRKDVDSKDQSPANNRRLRPTQCIYCKKIFSRKDSYLKHLNYGRCRSKDVCELKESVGALIRNQKELLKEIKEIKEAQLKEPIIQNIGQINQNIGQINQINQNVNMNVLCIGERDNYLDQLTETMGYDRALGFIKECALADLRGDCRLLNKVYFEIDPKAITYWGNKSDLSYYNEDAQRVIDANGIKLGKKLVNNLKNSYLKGCNCYKKDPDRKLDEFDIELWEKHVYDLSEPNRAKKIIKGLPIQTSNPNKCNDDGSLILRI